MKWASLGEGRDFIMRPIVEGMCRMESAKDGSLDLCDFADMNDALDARAENQRRADAALAKR